MKVWNCCKIKNKFLHCKELNVLKKLQKLNYNDDDDDDWYFLINKTKTVFRFSDERKNTIIIEIFELKKCANEKRK